MSSCSNEKESSPVNIIEHLPDDVLLNCLARVPRSYYHTLSLVSKRFRSFLASTELYETRRLLGKTESCIYVCLKHPSSPKTYWFTLSREPTRIPRRWFNSSCFSPWRILKKRTKNLMISASCHYVSLYWGPATIIGFNIYMINGCSTRVSFMDCRSHTWQEAPSLQVARRFPCVSVVDGKIYVVEGCPKYDYSNFMEVFDPKTQKWEHAPSPSAEIRGNRVYNCLAKEGNLYLNGDKNMVYKPKENKWDAVGSKVVSDYSCMIDNINYWCSSGVYFPRRLSWYDPERTSYGDLKGLKDLRKLPPSYNDIVRLVNYGGNLGVLWEEDVFAIKNKKIWCAEIEIEIERRNEEEIRGKVKWCDVVLQVPKSFRLEHLILTTL